MDRPILIDFFALSGTGKSTHTKALHDHLMDKGFKVRVLSFTLRRKTKNSTYLRVQRQPVSTLFRSMKMGFGLLKLSNAKTNVPKAFHMMKWSHRLLAYTNQIRSDISDDVDFVIMDPSLSSKLKKFYVNFDDASFVEALSLLERNGLTSDVVAIIEADTSVVKQRRLARGSPVVVEGDTETFSIRKAFGEIGQRNSSMRCVTVNYDCFSSLEGNIRRIADVCTRAKADLRQGS